MIYLAQSDTTTGFLSQNKKELNLVKNRDENTNCVICVCNLNILKNFVRIPKIHKNLIRRAKKTSFIYPNKLCIRVVKNERHAKWINSTFKDGWAYSTSANEHKKKFNLNWAKKQADIICDENLLQENFPSKIFALSKTKIKKIR